MDNKQCAVCEGYYPPIMLVGIMDTYMCSVCTLEMEQLLITGDSEDPGLGEDYKKGLPRTTTRHLENDIPILNISSPIHPKLEPELTTA